MTLYFYHVKEVNSMAMMIPDEVVNRVRQETNIVDVVSQYVQLKKSGKNLFGFCPFHDEKTPSFSVAEEKQIFHCFSCGRGGNVFTFLMEVDGLSFPEAVFKTAELSHVKLDERLTTSNFGEQKTDSKKEKLIKAHVETAELFHHVLLNTKVGEEALQYLLDRGLTRELIETFNIGFAPAERTMLYQYLTGKEYDKTLLSETGLFVERDSGELLDRFYNRIMFPIRNQQGKTIAFSGRIFKVEATEGKAAPKYLNSPETYLFNKRNVLFNYDLARANIRREKEVILFEGFMDVIASWDAGVKNGVASMGTSLTNEQIHMLDRVTDHVLIAYDGDNAGIEATKRAVDLLTEETHFDLDVLSLNEGLDPDEFIHKYGAASYKEMLAHGRDTVFAFKMRYYRKGINLQNESERLAYIEVVLNELLTITSAVEREVYLKQLSAEFDISLDSLNTQYHQLYEQKRTKKKVDKKEYYPEPPMEMPTNYQEEYPEPPLQIQLHTQKRKLNVVEVAERNLLNRLFHHEEAWIRVQAQKTTFNFVHEDYEMLFILFENFKETVDQKDTIEAFIDFVKEPHLKNLLVEIELMELSEDVSTGEIEDYLDMIGRKSSLQEQIATKNAKLIEVSRMGDTDTARQLLMEITNLSRLLKQ